MTKPVIESFPFDRLKKYSFEEADLFSRFARSLPALEEPFPLLGEIEKTLQKYLDASCSLHYVGLEEAGYEGFLARLSDPVVCPVVSLTPLPQKVIIALNARLSFALIDKLLGGEGQDGLDVSRKLTSLEEGILQYFFVKLLQKTENFLEKGSLRFQWDQLATSKTRLASFYDPEDAFYVVRFALALGLERGVVELGMPVSLVKNLETRSAPLFTSDALLPAGAAAWPFERWGHFRTVFWAEIGRATLTAPELAQLERGDIILFDDVYPEYDGRRLSGPVHLKVGDGSGGGFTATIVEAEKTLRLKVENVFYE